MLYCRARAKIMAIIICINQLMAYNLFMGRIKDTAGRPFKWGEPTKRISVPVRAVLAIENFIKEWAKENGPNKSNGA